MTARLTHPAVANVVCAQQTGAASVVRLLPGTDPGATHTTQANPGTNPGATHTAQANPGTGAHPFSGTDAVPSATGSVDTSLVALPLTLPENPLQGEPDSTQTSGPARPMFSEAYRDTTAQAVFGNRTVIVVPDRLPPPESESLTGNAVFQGFVLLLAATYALLLYRNLGDVRTLLDRISRDALSGKRMTEDAGGSGFPHFLNIVTAFGMLFMGVAAVKYGDSLMPLSCFEQLSHGTVMGLSLLATLATVALALFQSMLVRTAGAVTLSQPFAAQLVQLKQTYFSLLVLVTSPALLLFVLCPRGSGDVWFWVVAAELLVTATVYLGETLRLFLSKKVSILHWFLYLCTVEIFPLSLLWLLAAR